MNLIPVSPLPPVPWSVCKLSLKVGSLEPSLPIEAIFIKSENLMWGLPSLLNNSPLFSHGGKSLYTTCICTYCFTRQLIIRGNNPITHLGGPLLSFSFHEAFPHCQCSLWLWEAYFVHCKHHWGNCI